MKLSQHEITFNYLQKGIEVFAIFQYRDSSNQNIEISGFVNCIRKAEIYYCLIREIRSDNQLDYFEFEEDFYDKNKESIFEKIEDLVEYIKAETNLSLDNFRKAKNDIYYRY